MSGVFAGFLLFVLFGVNPRSDILAHFGGFVGGLVLGGALSFVPTGTLQKSAWNLVAFAVLLATVLATWTLALR